MWFTPCIYASCRSGWLCSGCYPTGEWQQSIWRTCWVLQQQSMGNCLWRPVWSKGGCCHLSPVRIWLFRYIEWWKEYLRLIEIKGYGYLCEYSFDVSIKSAWGYLISSSFLWSYWAYPALPSTTQLSIQPLLPLRIWRRRGSPPNTASVK